MLAWIESPGIGEVEIKSHQAASFVTNRGGDIDIGFPRQTFVMHGLDIVPLSLKRLLEIAVDVFVELDLHGVPVRGRIRSRAN